MRGYTPQLLPTAQDLLNDLTFQERRLARLPDAT